MSFLKASPPVPVLVPMDPGFKRIPFQFIPGGLTYNVASNYAETSTLNRDNPILQFTRGALKTISLEVRLFAETSTRDVKPLLDELERACLRDPTLARPPIWVFVWGSVFDIQVVVESIGDVRYDTLRPDGTVHGVTLALSLKRYEAYDLKLTDPDARPKDTFYRQARQGETWESLAGRHYREPLWGEHLRRLNPGLEAPVLGSTVLLPDADKLRGTPITPQSFPLARTEAGIAFRRGLFAIRGRSKVSTILTNGM